MAGLVPAFDVWLVWLQRKDLDARIKLDKAGLQECFGPGGIKNDKKAGR
jgi:hypothetical protein